MDLTYHEVVEVEDHQYPDATSEDLQEISETFIQSSESVDITVAKKKSFSKVTIRRKSYTQNSHVPVEEVQTTVNPSFRRLRPSTRSLLETSLKYVIFKYCIVFVCEYRLPIYRLPDQESSDENNTPPKSARPRIVVAPTPQFARLSCSNLNTAIPSRIEEF